jgi:serine/threonine protein kinase
MINSQDNSFCVTDFNISKRINYLENCFNSLVGTISYISPELLIAIRNCDNKAIFSLEKSDIYSLGLVFL